MGTRTTGLMLTGLLLAACGGTAPEPREEPLPNLALPVTEVVTAPEVKAAPAVESVEVATVAVETGTQTAAGWRLEDLPPIPAPEEAKTGEAPRAIDPGALAAALALAAATGLPGMPADEPTDGFTEEEINDVLLDPDYGDQAETLEVRWSDEFDEPLEEVEIGETVIEIDGTEVRCQGTMEVITTSEEYDVVIINDDSYDPGWDPVYDPDYGSWDYGYWLVEGPYDAERFGHGHHDHHDDHHADHDGNHDRDHYDDPRYGEDVHKKPTVNRTRRRQARRPDGSILLGAAPEVRRAERERAHETPTKLAPDPVTVAAVQAPTFRGAIRPGNRGGESRRGQRTHRADTLPAPRATPGAWERTSRRPATVPTPTRIQPRNTNITSTARINPHPTRVDPRPRRIDPRPTRDETPRLTAQDRRPPQLNQPGERVNSTQETRRVRREAPKRNKARKSQRKERRQVARPAPAPRTQPKARRSNGGGAARRKTVEAPAPKSRKRRGRK